jgi:hypothetical protein
MRAKLFFMSSATAIAIAKYVLPVPAGPIPKTMSKLRMVSMYSFCAMLFGVMMRLCEEM